MYGEEADDGRELPPYECADYLLEELDEVSDPWDYDEAFEDAGPDWD